MLYIPPRVATQMPPSQLALGVEDAGTLHLGVVPMVVLSLLLGMLLLISAFAFKVFRPA